MNCRHWTAALGLAFVLFGTTGCMTKFQRETFDMITVGSDDRGDVESILGEPFERTEGGRVWRYRERWTRRYACIEFDDQGHVNRRYWLPEEEPAPPPVTGT